MRSTTADRAVRTVVRTAAVAAGAVLVAAGAVLVAGCGSEAAPTASTAITSPAPFRQETVRADLEAALDAAGLPGGETEMGYPEPGPSFGSGSAADRKKLVALVARVSPCVVSWKSDDTGRLNKVLAGLEARGWEKSGPSEEVPMGENGTYYMATYEKHGWTLHARHTDVNTIDRSNVMATEDDCFAQVTDEEMALVEAAR